MSGDEIDIEPYNEDDVPQSGPFCRHFADPGDCDMVCGECGHLCHEHYQDNQGNCRECGCESFQAEEDADE
jgi:hypothetical protein